MLQQQQQISPRAERNKQEIANNMTKKLRAVSRQSGSSRAVKKNYRYDNGYQPDGQGGEQGSMFPQLPAVQQPQQGAPSPMMSMGKKSAGYSHVGMLNTMSPGLGLNSTASSSSNAHYNPNGSTSSSSGGSHHHTGHHGHHGSGGGGASGAGGSSGGGGAALGHQVVMNGGAVVLEEHSLGAVTSIKGLKPGNPNWTNQDNFFVLEGSDVRIYCVLDGHGENGHHVSRRCRENFPHFIKSANGKMDLAFHMMHNDLNASDIDVKCSGATCVMATINSHGRLCVFNCGDSRAVLGRRSTNGSIVAQQMSNDHKPDKPEERKRILSCGGHLGCRQVLVNQGGRGPVSMPVGPCRVWYQHRGETLGLAMSRSLGDAIVHKVGVTAEPELIEHPIDDADEFLIIATDGVWDVVDNNHAVQMVHNFAMRSANWSPAEAANCVCKFARSRWEKLSPMIDDITCIVVKLQPICIT